MTLLPKSAASKLYEDADRNHADHMADVVEKLHEKERLLRALGLSDDSTAEEQERIIRKIGEMLSTLRHLSPNELEQVLDQVGDILNELSHLSGEDLVKVLGRIGNMCKSMSQLS